MINEILFRIGIGIVFIIILMGIYIIISKLSNFITEKPIIGTIFGFIYLVFFILIFLFLIGTLLFWGYEVNSLHTPLNATN